MSGTEPDTARPLTSPSRVAKEALELVCTGERIDDAAEFYAADFIDHVNGREYHGLDGVRRSVGVYQDVLDDLRFEVLRQVTEGGVVASHFAMRGTNRGRGVRVTGIVISKVENSRIVEDVAASDTLEIVRQLGFWRTLLLLATKPRLLRH